MYSDIKCFKGIKWTVKVLIGTHQVLTPHWMNPFSVQYEPSLPANSIIPGILNNLKSPKIFLNKSSLYKGKKKNFSFYVWCHRSHRTTHWTHCLKQRLNTLKLDLMRDLTFYFKIILSSQCDRKTFKFNLYINLKKPATLEGEHIQFLG